MDLQQLRYFVAVAQFGSFTRAASELDVAQPSLWRQTKALEENLGVALFERFGRRVRLTSSGSLLLPQAEQLLSRAEKFLVMGRELSVGRAGLVTIACAYPHIPKFLMPLIGGFRREHPQVHVALHELSELPRTEALVLGEVDFLTSLVQADPNLVGKQLGEARIIVVTSDDHPWRHRKKILVSDLANVPVVTGGPLSLSRRLLEPTLRELGLGLDIVHESVNISTTVSMARAGLGVGIVGDDIIQSNADSTWPVLCDERGPIMTPIWMYWSARRALAPPAELFVRHIRNAR
ncbi:LysR family transcriptional regulator [Novosphingobium sp. KA1]|uniref:LysR family transcriptional regulator n=1 Tax=Novosphingobium sp. (strain KA1) TaxID=164608 RepID=UPI0000DD05A2|nr:LysR family transcriptional regulator [Novosphingobium sp. KA1]QSR20651.1 LysR family transcriptional regulator [Novosphingobium sp. KA1]BAF03478.1 putative transcriptional regulator [Novosphingobium sp. KA1]